MVDYKLLIIGNIYDNHLIRLIKNLKGYNKNILVDVISEKQDVQDPRGILELIDTIYWFYPPKANCKILNICQRISDFNVLLNHIASDKHYDIVNIHFPRYEYTFSIPYLNKIANYMVLTPWGSDVYRVSKIKKAILRCLYSNADFVCCNKNRFGQDVRKIFGLPLNKLVNLDIGSETIDYIFEYKDIFNPQQSRKMLSLEGDYFITCGYNAQKSQRHTQIIEAICRIRKQLPQKLTLLFPMTYPNDAQYIEEIKDLVKKNNLQAYFFTEYLNIPELFALRHSTDMFVHVQTTDANAASVQEYLALGKNVINGSWLRYKELEIDLMVPYHIANNIDSLSSTIYNAYKSGAITINSKVLDYIESYGWKKWIIQWNSFFCSLIKTY